MIKRKTTNNQDGDVLKRPVARFQIELLAERMADVERMLHLSGVRTKRELFEHAFTVFQYILEQVGQGKRLGFLGSNGQFEPMLYPPLENAHSYAQTQVKENRLAGEMALGDGPAHAIQHRPSKAVAGGPADKAHR